MASQQFTYDVAQQLTANTFTKEGYTFAGWNTLPNGNGTSYTDGQSVSNLTTTNGGTVTLYAEWDGAKLKANTVATTNGLFLGTPITRDKIKSVQFATSLGENTASDPFCWDVSEENDGKVLMWATGDDTTGYDVTIGQDGGVIANPSSAYLFSYIGYTLDATIDLTNFDTRKVTNMSNMFSNCKTVPSLNVSGFATAKVTNMQRMFYNCASVTTLDVSNFNTANVTNMSGMFEGAWSNMFGETKKYGMVLTEINGLDHFNTSKVTDMSNMFYMCKELQEVDVSSFDTSNVTSMQLMFAGNYFEGVIRLEITSIKGIENLNVSKVENFKSMFAYTKITSLNLENWDTSSATNMSNMFEWCQDLTYLNVSNFNTHSVTAMRKYV